MVLVEFIEAIGRVADKINIPHYLEELEEEESMKASVERSSVKKPKVVRTLAWKIEAFIIQAVRACLGP